MMNVTSGAVTAFGLGFLYFLGALPGGTALGAPLWLATLAAWAGYSCGSLVVLFAGVPLRDWLARKLRIPVQRDPSKFLWRIWDRWGLAGLGLLAPVTVGPQAASLLALAIGERPKRIFLSLSLGVIPWCLLFATLLGLGIKITR
ncbi:MAG: small multi-drug export protein [Chthoniobacterales bacterium]|nr:small multi-drug export protein [Chthoniobacterales bacterium]